MQRKSSDKMAAMANDMNKSRAKIAIKMALENIQKIYKQFVRRIQLKLAKK